MSRAVSEGVFSGGYVSFSKLYWLKSIEQLRLARRSTAPPAEVGAAVATCILLGFAAAEAYVAEMPLLEGRLRGVDPNKAEIVSRQVEKRGLEEAIASVADRNERKLPWKRELKCLRELRNALVHFDVAYRMLDEWPKRLTDCSCRQIIEGWDSGPHDWTSQLTIAPVAGWSVVTVRQGLEKLHQFIGGKSPWTNGIPEVWTWPAA